MTSKDYKIIRKAAMIEASCILPSHYEVSKRFFNQVMKRFQHDKDLKEAVENKSVYMDQYPSDIQHNSFLEII